MKKSLTIQTMIAISGLAVIPFHFAEGQAILLDQVIPEVKTEDREKGDPAESRGKGDPTESRGKGDPEESRGKGNPTKVRGKGEPGESVKSRNRENDPAPREAQKPPVQAPDVPTNPVTPQVKTPRVTRTPMVPQVPPYGSGLPSEYREQNSPVVSYQVDPDSMVSRDDILFLQGSTSFADRYSFETVRDLAVAMGDPSLARERFVVEGHASAEGGYDSNLALSQRRAERIVRDIVRFGISPDRLIPVGYGESEAAYASRDPEQYRQLDRKVVVFRLSQ